MKIKRLLPLIRTAVILTAAGCLLAGGCKSENQAEAVDHLTENTPVIVKPVTQESSTRIISVSGTLVADKTTPTGFLVAGKVDQVFADEGDHIPKGFLLATVEGQDYKNRLEMAKAAVLRAKDAYERYEPLYKEGAFAEKNFIELKAGLAEAVAARNIAAKALNDTRLYSPISGIIGKKSIEVGQMVSPAVSAFTIVKTDVIYARMSVPESEIGEVVMGKEAKVTLTALPGQTFTGKVSMIAAVADERTRTYPVKIELENPQFMLRTGMIAKAVIQTDKTVDMLTVPGVAIVRDADNLTYVFVTNAEKSTAIRKRVLTGRAFKSEIAIRNGIDPHDVVIISGQNKLTDGTPITILQTEQSIPSPEKRGA